MRWSNVGALLIIIGVFITCTTEAKVYYSDKQLGSLHLARQVGDLYGFPETLQGIILQESSACLDRLGDDGKSLGCGNVTVPAAKDVLSYCKLPKNAKACAVFVYYYTSDTSLATDLTINDDFNIIIAALYFKMHYDYFKSKGFSLPWTRAIVAYNTGRNRVKNMSETELYNNSYRAKIKYRIKNIRKYNKLRGLWI